MRWVFFEHAGLDAENNRQIFGAVSHPDVLELKST